MTTLPMRIDYGSFGPPIDVTISGAARTVLGRALALPTLRFGRDELVSLDDKGSWTTTGKQHFIAGRAAYWAILVLAPSPSRIAHNRDHLQKFAGELQSRFMQLGHFADASKAETIADPCIVEGIQMGNIEGYLSTIRSTSPSPPDFIVIVMPTRSDHEDAALRHWSYVHSGVAIQIVNYRMFCNPTNTTLDSIVLRVNMKACSFHAVHGILNSQAQLGGSNWALAKGGLPPFPANGNSGSNIMVIGISTKRLSFGAATLQQLSVVGVVASYDSSLTRYTSHIDLLPISGGGKVENLKDVVMTVLRQRRRMFPRHFDASAGPLAFECCYPSHVVVYRSDVDNQHRPSVTQHEIATIKAAARDVSLELDGDAAPNPHFAFIFVNQSDIQIASDNRSSKQTGIVLDRGLAAADLFQFFLGSHAENVERLVEYTVTHYDSDAFNSNRIQMLTNNLCYMYGISTRPIAVPVPVHYAQRICDRAWHMFPPELDMRNQTAEGAEFAEFVRSNFRKPHVSAASKLWFM